MKNKINLVAVLTLSVLSFSITGANATEVTQNVSDDIEIISVKDEVQNVDNIIEENIVNISCPCGKNMSAPVNPRVKMTNEDCECETGAALPTPCGSEESKKTSDCEENTDPCEPCEASPACPVTVSSEPCAKSEPCSVVGCDKDCGPTCITSPSIDKDDLNRLQVYAYPRYMNLWGGNPTVGSNLFNNGSYSTFGALPANKPCNCANSGIFDHDFITPHMNMITGAAANIANKGIPVQNNPCLGMNPSIPVDTSRAINEKYGCPLTVHSASSIEVPTYTLEKLDLQQVTGAAVPLVNTFDDVTSGYWASEDINKLSASKVISGYPDQTFRPNRMVTRAEFAALAVSGLNYQGEKYYNKALFGDVPQHHWANSVIDKGVNGGLLAGYPDGKFKPNNHVTRAEAMVILAKALPSCDIDDCKANEILKDFSDTASIPVWAKVPIAKVIQANALKKSPDCDNKVIRANDFATRAEIAGMLANIRIAMGIDPAEIACGCTETGAAAYVEVQKMMQYPTLKVKFDDQISAKDSQAGDGFRAYSTESVTIDGINYPAGSIVRGKIVEVIRPSHNCKGGLKIVFTEIQNGDCKTPLPEEVLSAQVLKTKNPNIVAKIFKAPFTWSGAIVGNTARAVGGIIVNAGNGVEAMSNNFGTATGELLQGKFKASMRSYGQSALEVLKTPVEMANSAISGTAGLAEVSMDELAYVISPDGTRISQISPNEVVQIAFGTYNKTACNKK